MSNTHDLNDRTDEFINSYDNLNNSSYLNGGNNMDISQNYSGYAILMNSDRKLKKFFNTGFLDLTNNGIGNNDEENMQRNKFMLDRLNIQKMKTFVENNKPETTKAAKNNQWRNDIYPNNFKQENQVKNQTIRSEIDRDKFRNKKYSTQNPCILKNKKQTSYRV